ncbi:MAG: translation initiation factor IF-2, partial [Candidatus Delongbacteria bacterium]
MKGKKKQISKIAKELELSTGKILDFINSEHPGVDTSRNIATKVDEDVYCSILKNFNITAYKNYVEDDNTKKDSDDKVINAQKKQIDIKSRISEIEDIISVSSKDDESDKKSKRSRRKIKDDSAILSDDAEKKKDRGSAPKEDKADKEDRSSESERSKVKRPVIKKRAQPIPVEKDIIKTSEAKPAEDIKEDADKSVDKKSKKGKVKDVRSAIKEDKKPKGKPLFKRRRHKKVSVVVTDGDVIETADENIKRSKKKRKKGKVNQEEVKDSVKETLSKMSSETSKSFKKKKKKKQQEDGTEIEVEVNVIKVSEFISTQELANKLDVNVTDIITKCFNMGLMVTINQRLDKETIELIAAEFDVEVEFESEYDEDFFAEDEQEDPEQLEERNPIITVMGHVDHGKTSLLDHIRNTRVVSGESGGITQHIGAYVVDYNNKRLTFLDTPGHEAFTAMRSRGAKVTDIVIIVIAADDKVNAQTNEAIDHALLAEVPIIFALNKMDRPNADPEKIRTQLSQRNVLVEQWGGKYQSVEISAKTGQGIEELLDAIVLESDMLELKANPNCQALGTVIESKLDKGFGAVSTILIQKGTLQIGDVFVCGQTSGRVRAMLNERRENVKEAKPAYPVMVLGFSSSPNAGDSFVVVDSEQKARSIAGKREQINRAQAQHKINIVTLDNVSEQIKLGDVKNLNLIIKADADGSVEAIGDTLMKLSNKEV